MKDTHSAGFSAYFTAFFAWLASFTINDVAALVGIVTAIIACVVNIHYKRKEFQLLKAKMNLKENQSE